VRLVVNGVLSIITFIAITEITNNYYQHIILADINNIIINIVLIIFVGVTIKEIINNYYAIYNNIIDSINKRNITNANVIAAKKKYNAKKYNNVIDDIDNNMEIINDESDSSYNPDGSESDDSESNDSDYLNWPDESDESDDSN
jgi:hypothetical protein